MVLRISPVCIFDVYKCCIAVFEDTGILHSVCEITPYRECSHTTRTSPEWMLLCDVVINENIKLFNYSVFYTTPPCKI